MEGKGHWFETEDAARAFVFKHFKRGARSFDVGCFQINYKWHSAAFESIEEMFDPVKNARYAAQFLSQLHREMGSWREAAGAYHSRTPKFAKIYKARFDSIHRNLAPVEVAAAPAAVTNRANTFPLLTGTSAATSRGSLVPLGGTARRSLFGTGGDNG
ncbi:transglycosylase SLT domain-containing protein [Tateyamaria sp.]|uniref:transglycosylase SLT domain-containing protein n=1 Tax=Tateyamaria sp. TaxID=1929288 RepID=UPI003B21F125